MVPSENISAYSVEPLELVLWKTKMHEPPRTKMKVGRKTGIARVCNGAK